MKNPKAFIATIVMLVLILFSAMAFAQSSATGPAAKGGSIATPTPLETPKVATPVPDSNPMTIKYDLVDFLEKSENRIEKNIDRHIDYTNLIFVVGGIVIALLSLVFTIGSTRESVAAL